MKDHDFIRYVGIDVSKAKLDVFVAPTGEVFQVDNDDKGLERLLQQLQASAATLVVMEATGGLETLCATRLARQGYDVAVVNPFQVRSFAKAKGDLVSALLSFKAGGGAFRHVLEGGSNMMSTEQALRALISIGEYKSSGEAYNFYASGSHPGAFAVFQGTASVPVAVQPATGMASGSAKSEQAAALSELSADASPVQGASGAVATAPEAASSKKGYLLAGGILAGSGLIGGGAYLLLGRKRGLS